MNVKKIHQFLSCIKKMHTKNWFPFSASRCKRVTKLRHCHHYVYKNGLTDWSVVWVWARMTQGTIVLDGCRISQRAGGTFPGDPRGHSRRSMYSACSTLFARADRTTSWRWRRGVVVSGVRRTSEVNPRRARLVPRWVTVFWRVGVWNCGFCGAVKCCPLSLTKPVAVNTGRTSFDPKLDAIQFK